MNDGFDSSLNGEGDIYSEPPISKINIGMIPLK
jgi:hypothetical protein